MRTGIECWTLLVKEAPGGSGKVVLSIVDVIIPQPYDISA